MNTSPKDLGDFLANLNLTVEVGTLRGFRSSVKCSQVKLQLESKEESTITQIEWLNFFNFKIYLLLSIKI